MNADESRIVVHHDSIRPGKPCVSVSLTRKSSAFICVHPRFQSPTAPVYGTVTPNSRKSPAVSKSGNPITPE
jgi:hypothetical protein